MNRIHRLVWNRRESRWIVAHEHAASQGKQGSTRRKGIGRHARMLAATAAAIATVLPAPSFALPTAPTVVNGTASFNNSGNTLTVTNSDGAIINWNSFSIGQGELARFVQPSAASQVLNRVTGGDPSQILGSLQSNGRVFLINPNGIAFGATAQVNVAGLVASTLMLSDADFLANMLSFTAIPGAGKLGNDGTIKAGNGGQVVLVAPNVDNSGVIQAPNGDIVLAAGKRVSLIDINQPEIEVEVSAADNRAINLGQIIGSRIGIHAGAIDAGGTVDASAVEIGDGGRIVIKAKGDTQASATIKADANDAGNGGNVLVWADGTTTFDGHISARGGAQSGDGGFAEVSGAQLGITGHADLSAPNGNAGTLLLDPGSITISTNPTNPATGTVQDTWVMAQLAGSNLILDTTYAGFSTNNATQDITVDAALNWSSAHTLTLNAGRNIALNQNITVSGGGGLTLNAGQSTTGTSSLLYSEIDLGGGTLSFRNGLSATGNLKNVVLISSDDTTLNTKILDWDFGWGTVDGVTIGSNLTTNGHFIIRNDLTLANGVTVDKGSGTWFFDRFDKPAGWVHRLSTAGTATVTISGGALLIEAYGDQTLQIDRGVTVQGYGVLGEPSRNEGDGWMNATLINDGTIIGNTLDQRWTIGNAHFTNNGIVSLAAGAIDLNADSWTNAGIFGVETGTLNLGGRFTTSDIGTIERSGGSINLTGMLDNTDVILDIGSAGPFGSGGLTSLSGTLTSGTLISGDDTPLNSASPDWEWSGYWDWLSDWSWDPDLSRSLGRLDGVTIGGNLRTNGNFDIVNSLTLADGVTINKGSGFWIFDGFDKPAGTVHHLATPGTATVNNAGGALLTEGDQQTLQIVPGVTLQGYGFLGQPHAWWNDTIINDGTIIANASDEGWTIWPSSFINNGTINLVAGTLDLDAYWWTNAGIFGVENGTLNLGGHFTTADIGTIDRSGGSINLTGTLDNSGATLDIGSAGPFGRGGLTSLSGTLTNGTLISGDDTPLNTESEDWGRLDGVTIGSNLTTNGNFDIANDLTLADGVTVNKGSGLWVFDGFDKPEGWVHQLVTPGTATVNNAGGALLIEGVDQTLEIDSGVTMQGYGSVGQAQVWWNGTLFESDAFTFSNFGTIIGNTPNESWTIWPSSFINYGTINLVAGTLDLNAASWTNAGTFGVEGGTLNLGGRFTTADIGTIERSGGTINLTGTLDNSGDTLDIGSAGPFGRGGLNSITGILASGTLISGDDTTLNISGWLDGVTIGSNLTTDSSFYIANNLTLADGVSVNMGSGTWIFDGRDNTGEGDKPTGTVHHLATTGTATVNNAGGQLRIEASNDQTLQIARGLTVQGYGNLGGGWSDTIINDGTIIANTPSQSWTISPYNFINTGTLQTRTGTLQIVPAFANTGLIEVWSGTTVSTTNNDLINAAGGIIRGTGTIDLGNFGGTNRTLTNNGTLDPGVGVNGVGTLTLKGNLVMGADGKLHIDLDGTGANQYDKLAVIASAGNASASLAGTLEVAERGAFVPGAYFASLNDAFPNMLTVNGGTTGLSGAFTTHSLLTSAPADVAFTFASSGSPGITNTTTSITRWATDASGIWGTAANWSRGIPTTGMDTVISRPLANPVITIDIAAATPRAFTLDESLRVATGGSFTLPSSLTGTSQTLTLAGGTLTNNNALTLTGLLDLQSGTLNGTGTITLGSGGIATKTTAGTATIAEGFNNGSIINIAAGQLVLAGGGTQTGIFDVASGASLDFSGGPHQFADGSEFAGIGVFAHSGGTAQLTGTSSGLAIAPTTTLDISAFLLTGSGNLTNNGTLNGTNATLSGKLINNGTANLTSTILSSGFTNTGTLNVTGSLVAGGPAATVAAGTVNLRSGATLTKSTGTLDWTGGTIDGTGTIAFTNGGLIGFSGNGDRVMNSPNLNFSFSDLELPSGSLTLNAGHLTFNATGSNVTSLPTGTTLTVQGTGILTNNGPLSIGGTFNLHGGTYTGTGSLVMAGGTLNRSGGSWTSSGTMTNTGTLDLGTGSYSSPIINTGTLSVGGATLSALFTNSGTLNVTGSNTFGGGLTLSAGSSTIGTGSISLGGSPLTLSGSGTANVSDVSLTNLGGSSLSSGQTLALSNAALTTTQSFSNSGTLSLSGTSAATLSGGGTLAGAFITNAGSTLNFSGGTFTLGAGTNLGGAGGTNFAGGSFTGTAPLSNSGTLNVTANTSIGGSFSNSGTMTLANGVTLSHLGGYTQSAGTTRLGTGIGTSANLTGNVALTGGTFSGSGTVAGNVDMSSGNGMLAAGFSPGSLTITGNLTLGAGSTTTIELGGTTPGAGYDVINVGGLATLGGTLNVLGYNGFTPTGGNSFSFLNFTTSTGSFAAINNAFPGLNLSSFSTYLQLLMPGTLASTATSSLITFAPESLPTNSLSQSFTQMGYTLASFAEKASISLLALAQLNDPEAPLQCRN